MLSLSQRLVAHEHRPADADDSPGRAAFRVCEKLRQPLCTLAGVAGYRSLIARSLALARARHPWLAQIAIGADATLDLPAEIESRLDPGELDRGGALLVAELLGLLSALIGDTLTLRLVRNAWPEATAAFSKTETAPS
jgi:hypothetical protein